jgi:hypothetical protein
MNAPESAFPLSWPPGWPRKPNPVRPRARFGAGSGVSLGVGVQRVTDELRRLGATGVIISTNVRPRLDGLPSGDAANPVDPGAAVYFRIKDQPRVLACDKWGRLADNLAALAKHVEAIRGQVRWGVGSIEQAFGGYLALAAMGASKPWWEILGVDPAAQWHQIEAKREALLHRHHPDKGGNANTAAEINAAFDTARRERAQ